MANSISACPHGAFLHSDPELMRYDSVTLGKVHLNHYERIRDLVPQLARTDDNSLIVRDNQ